MADPPHHEHSSEAPHHHLGSRGQTAESMVLPTAEVLFVARHAERLDKCLHHELGVNWVEQQKKLKDGGRPWDPPLTAHGELQGHTLGQHLAQLVHEHQVPPLTAIYTSPLLRCAMTARQAALGYAQAMHDTHVLPLRLEPGLIESMDEGWYLSWCLPDSNGEYGSVKRWLELSCCCCSCCPCFGGVHPMAKAPVSQLVDRSTLATVEPRLLAAQHENRTKYRNGELLLPECSSSSPVVAEDTVASVSLKPSEYRYRHYEHHHDHAARLHHVITELTSRHVGESILVVSHGSPVEDVYENLFHVGRWQGRWEFGTSPAYASVSMYRQFVEENAHDPTHHHVSWEHLVVNDDSFLQEVNQHRQALHIAESD